MVALEADIFNRKPTELFERAVIVVIRKPPVFVVTTIISPLKSPRLEGFDDHLLRWFCPFETNGVSDSH
jgi:hypothetical protein